MGNNINMHSAIRRILMPGYNHYSRDEEKALIDSLLIGDISEFQDIQNNFNTSSFVLASQPIRSIKNGLICFVAVVCRSAADLGANDVHCYALSDYLIQQIEENMDVRQFYPIILDVIRSYSTLVSEGRQKNYSLPVSQAIKQIRQNIYSKLTSNGIAQKIGVHPTYLSNRFSAETGMTLHEYMMCQKLEEGKRLLTDSNHSIIEISDMLGFCDGSHFTRNFKKLYGETPNDSRKNAKK